MKENTQALNRCKRCNRQLTDRNAEYGWRCAEILGISFDQMANQIRPIPTFSWDANMPKDSDGMEEYIRKSLEFYEKEQKIVALMKDNPNIVAYTVDDDIFWVDLSTFQGIGVLPDGTLIYGKNISLDEFELAKLVLLQENSSHKTAYVPYINALAEKIADEIGFTTDSARANYIQRIKRLEYYQIHDISDQLRQKFIDQMNFYATASKFPDPVALKIFYNAVEHGSPGDLKNKEPYKNYSAFIFDGEIIDQDVPGNILFGFLGKYFKIPDKILFMGAGYAQLAAGTSDLRWIGSYFDDPRDRDRIKQGIECYMAALYFGKIRVSS